MTDRYARIALAALVGAASAYLWLVCLMHSLTGRWYWL